MRERDTSGRPFAAVCIFELRAPSLFHHREQPLPITADICTASLVSVLADIIMTTCVSIEPVESQQTRHSDDGQPLEY